jgi:L-lactate dehydrogenase complex protein LldG
VEEKVEMTSRDQILSSARAALNRRAGDPIPPPPPVLLREGPNEFLMQQFKKALEALGGKVVVVKTPAEAEVAIDNALNGRTFIRSPHEPTAATEVGITSADYALADTGSLVIFEPTLLSLLPRCHIVVIKESQIVASLDDVFRLHPLPGSMVVITGPSRTADIEMRLVRGVHGPGEIHVIIIEDVTHSDSNTSHHL